MLTGSLVANFKVHPKLEHNPGLVQRLERFHECYNRVKQFMYSPASPMSRFCKFLERDGLDEKLDSSVDSEFYDLNTNRTS